MNPASTPAELMAKRAAHVVLRLGLDGPRRRAGDVCAWRPLLDDVVGNAFAAAFADRRHAGLKPDDRHKLAITIMLLGEPQPIVPSRLELAVGSDGVLAEWPDGSHHALFPDAWAFHPSADEFIAEALRRSPGDRSDQPRLYRFSVAIISDT